MSASRPEQKMDADHAVVLSQVCSANEAAEILRYTTSSVRRMCRNGDLVGVKSAGYWIILRASVEAYAEGRNSTKATHRP